MVLLGLPGCMGFSLVAASTACSPAAACGLLVAVASLAVEQGLQGTDLQQLWLLALSNSSVVVAHGLSCSTAHGIFPGLGGVLGWALQISSCVLTAGTVPVLC